MSLFKFHLSERTTREVMCDPLLPDDPEFADIRAALQRVVAREVAEQKAREDARDKEKYYATQ